MVGYQFAEKLTVRDPHTYEKDKKPLKPFMVNNSVVVFEKNKIVLHPKDKDLISQLEQYRVKSISSTGLPTFTSENDHIIDALNLALLIVEQKYGHLMRTIVSSKIALIDGFDRPDNVVDRNIEKEEQKIFSAINMGKDRGYIVNGVAGKARRRNANQFTRGSF